MTVSSSVQFQFNNLPKMNDAMRAELRNGLERSAVVVHGAAVMMCPVVTGNLRSSLAWRVDRDGETARVGTNVEYALPVEYRRPYLRPALDNSKGNIERFLSAAIGQAVKGVSR